MKVAGKQLASATEDYNTYAPGGEMMFNFLVSVAQNESAEISSRVRTALD